MPTPTGFVRVKDIGTGLVVTVTESSGSASNLTVSLSTGATASQSSPGAQAITATPSGGTPGYTYAWTAKYQDGRSANSLISNAAIANPTLTTTAYAQRVIATVAPKLATALGQKLAAQAVPVLGAVAGAGLNAAFLRYYREMAEIRFALLRLAEQHGAEEILTAFAKATEARPASLR